MRIVILLILSTLGSAYSYTQSNYRYVIKLDTVELSSTKALFDEISSNLQYSSVRIYENYSFSFLSSERYESQDIDFLINDFGSNVIHLEKNREESNLSSVEKNGGQDCPDAAMVCSNNSFSGNASGSGTTQELNSVNDGCMSIEHQSSWYYINVDTPAL